MNIRVATQAVSILCALVALGAVLVWAPVCPGMLELANGNMVPMRCAYAGKTAVLLALLILVVEVAGLATKRTATMAIVGLSLALVVITFTTPLSGGICGSADMACHTTAVWLRVCGVVSAVAALAGYFGSSERKRVQEV